MADRPADTVPANRVLAAALALAFAAAVSLGLARFAYALLLPPMRADLGWSYLTAGAMNTVNAAGYLVGALLAPRVFARVDARIVMLAGGVAASGLMAAHGALRGDAMLYALRFLLGLASAASFVGGGLMAARLASRASGRMGSGFVLGLYYGGTGFGIVVAAVVVPPVVAEQAAAWTIAWVLLGAAALGATLFTAHGTRGLAAAPGASGPPTHVAWRRFGFGLAGYSMFGLGYIGYMTFIVTLLREQGLAGSTIAVFYVLLGLGVVASSWLWAGLLQRRRDGRPLAVLNGLLSIATLLPVLSAHPVVVFASGALFGSVFLSVVASTTALVRHNAPPEAWASGIAAFTIMFAAGQIIGPALIGAIADGPGGLRIGLVVSAGLLALGSLLAQRQRALGEG
jgi:predicted MFS family arabinose efflux permease